MTDAVNHPKHYNSHPSGIEAITVIEHMTFNVGNAIKYLCRAGLKPPDPMIGAADSKAVDRMRGKHLEDLRKAAWYIEREIERVQNAGKPS